MNIDATWLPRKCVQAGGLKESFWGTTKLGGHFGSEKKYLAPPLPNSPQTLPATSPPPPPPLGDPPLLGFSIKIRPPPLPVAPDSPFPSPNRKNKKYPKRPPNSKLGGEVRCAPKFWRYYFWLEVLRPITTALRLFLLFEASCSFCSTSCVGVLLRRASPPLSLQGLGSSNSWWGWCTLLGGWITF